MDLQNVDIKTRYNNPDHNSPAPPPKFKKGKLVPVHAMKVYRESIGILFNLGSRWR